MRIIGNDPSVPRQEHAVASGALTDGTPVVVNSDGTVSVVAETSITQNIGTAVVYSAANGQNYNTAIYDATADRVVVFYKDTSNSDYGVYVVGTVSGTSISFGTPTVFNSYGTSYISPTYDPDDGKIVIAFEDDGNFGYGVAMVGTVSGSSVSFGGKSVFNNNGTTRHIASTYDTSANKHIFTFAWNTFWSACTATVSSGSISFGSVLELHQSSNQYRYISCAYDEAADKTVVCGADLGNSTRPQVRVVTVSGTSLSKGNATQLSTNATSSTTCVYDGSIQKVIVSQNTGNNDGDSFIGTISGTTISFGSAIQFASVPCGRLDSIYDPDAQKTVLFFADQTNAFSTKPSVVVGTASGTSISYGSIVQIRNKAMDQGAITYDTNSNQSCVVWYNTSDTDGEASMFRNAYTQQNLTSENYIGIARSGAADTAGAIIDTQGAIADDLSSLTAGQSYFVQTDGTLGTTAADPSVFAGTAVSATKLIVKG